jgi:16S rRNA A1518/A1519 N6-dimethyltransferase RsmA/KsgA/DIM1 with predicted DNA glycosylase/AP lyase activity
MEMDYLENYYNKYDEESRLLSKHGKVEYITTQKYIHDCIRDISAKKILELGAGTGRYSIALAKEGLEVTAVELFEHNINQLKEKLDGSEPLTVLQGNACVNALFLYYEINQ